MLVMLTIATIRKNCHARPRPRGMELSTIVGSAQQPGGATYANMLVAVCIAETFKNREKSANYSFGATQVSGKKVERGLHY